MSTGLGIAILAGMSLAVDASVVAAARGAVIRHRRGREAALMATTFAGFQGGMLLLGGLGLGLIGVAASWDHWVVFVLLGLLGAKFARDGLRGEGGQAGDCSQGGWKRLGVLLALGLATSIDAAAAGVPLAAMGRPPLADAAVVAAITAVMVLISTFAAERLGRRFHRIAPILAGLVLVALGTQVLISHLLDHG